MEEIDCDCVMHLYCVKRLLKCGPNGRLGKSIKIFVWQNKTSNPMDPKNPKLYIKNPRVWNFKITFFTIEHNK